MNTKIALFEGRGVRKVYYDNEWWFSVIDVCSVLTASVNPGAYWRKLKQRLNNEGSEVVTFCHGLKLEALEKKTRKKVSSKGNYLKVPEKVKRFQ